jgi:hypothetical protein
MLNERDRLAWADLEYRLRDDAAPGFVPIGLPSPHRRTPPRWLAYVMAVVVPLLLPTVSVMEMRPAASELGILAVALVAGLVGGTAALLRFTHRTAAAADRGGHSRATEYPGMSREEQT